jgi:hypothetical protein
MNDDLAEDGTSAEVSGGFRFSSNFFVGRWKVIRAERLQAWMDSNMAIGSASDLEAEEYDD